MRLLLKSASENSPALESPRGVNRRVNQVDLSDVTAEMSKIEDASHPSVEDCPVPAPASIPLIATKLQPPRASGARLSRPRLGDLASRLLEVPLTLVSAPAGFG